MDASKIIAMAVKGAPFSGASGCVYDRNDCAFANGVSPLCYRDIHDHHLWNALAATAKALGCVLGTDDPAALDVALWAAGVGMRREDNVWRVDYGPEFSVEGYEDGNDWIPRETYRTHFVMRDDGRCSCEIYEAAANEPDGFRRVDESRALTSPGDHVAAYAAFKAALEAKGASDA